MSDKNKTKPKKPVRLEDFKKEFSEEEREKFLKGARKAYGREEQ